MHHPDGIADTSKDRIHGVTLEQEERIQAREAELERISAQAELGTQDGREQRTRELRFLSCVRPTRPHLPPSAPCSLRYARSHDLRFSLTFLYKSEKVGADEVLGGSR